MDYFKKIISKAIKNIRPRILKKKATRAPSVLCKKYTPPKNYIKHAIRMQILAKYHPQKIPWPPEPWHPTDALDKRLKILRDKYHTKMVWG